MPNNAMFLDAAYAIALASATDRYHERAERLAERISRAGTRLLTTRAVMLEIGNVLAKQRFRAAAVELLDALERDPAVEIVALSEELCREAFALYGVRSDKEWGLTDCVSFVVMRRRNIVAAPTADDHFRQAGFRSLLLDEQSGQ